MSVTHIYVLADPTTGEIRYIGKTSRKLEGRLRNHISSSAKSNTYVARWIRSLNTLPTIKLLFSIAGDGALAEQGIISVYRALGYRLTNLTAGGDGTSGWNHSPETRAKISASNKGKHTCTPEMKAHLRAVRTGFKHTPEARAKIAAAGIGRRILGRVAWNKGQRATSAARVNMSAAQNRRTDIRSTTPETREKLRLAQTGKTYSTESRLKMSAAHKGKIPSAETRLKLSASNKGRSWSEARRNAYLRRWGN